MDLEYIDHEDLGVTPEFINEVLGELVEDEEYNKTVKWWEERGYPQGLQTVGLHLYPSMREYVLSFLTEEDRTPRHIVVAALLIDSMLS